MWWFPSVYAFGLHVFPSLKERQESKARSSGFGCHSKKSEFFFKFNEKALTDLNNNTIWLLLLTENSTKSRISVQEQGWGRDHVGGCGRSLDEMIVPKIRGLLVKQLDSTYISTAETIELTGRLDARCETKQRVKGQRCIHVCTADVTTAEGGRTLSAHLGITMRIRTEWYSQRVGTSLLAEQSSILPLWAHESPWDSFPLPHEVEIYLILGKVVSSSENRCQVRRNRKELLEARWRDLSIT